MTTLNWAGINWDVRHDPDHAYGPGPNHWDQSGVSVDAAGNLHLAIRQDAQGRWQCAEIQSQDRFGFGKYKWVVAGVLADGGLKPIQNLDRNVVLGLFQYPTPDVGPDGTHEIDIELSYWAKDPATYKDFINWSTYSTQLASTTNNLAGQKWRGATYPDGYSSPDPQSHFYYRTANGITFTAQDAYNAKPIAALTDSPMAGQQISQADMPVHLNLWLSGGLPPYTGKSVEVVISAFSFMPQK